ncbi:unnamed protein product, partial [Rotaria magnacalcarata]
SGSSISDIPVSGARSADDFDSFKLDDESFCKSEI